MVCTSVCVHVCMLSVSVLSTLCNPMGCNPPDSSVHGILQARILEWVAISFSRGSSWSRNWTHVSCGFWLQADSLPLSHHGSPCVCICVCVCINIYTLYICMYIYICIHYICILNYSSFIKKEGNIASCSHIDKHVGYYAKWSEAQKDKYWMIALICGIDTIQLTSEYNKIKKQTQIQRRG